VTIIEADPRTGASQALVTFSDVLLATPVGYGPTGDNLFIVTIGESGSWLWERSADQQLLRRGQLATGRTTDWKLSPDGTRLAFIDVKGGERGSTGKTFVFATGAVRTAAGAATQVGVTWKPGSALPEFGGPGGSIRIDTPEAEGAYIVPLEWSPDGTVLVAKVVEPRINSNQPGFARLELMSATSRLHASEKPGAIFLGWAAE
jgi:hypothetical protein